MKPGKLTEAVCAARALALEEAAGHLSLSWTDDPMEYNEGRLLAARLLKEAVVWRVKADYFRRTCSSPNEELSREQTVSFGEWGVALAEHKPHVELTEHERKMLSRLERAGVLHWTEIKADDTRTLGRLVKKGAAREIIGRRGLRAWEPMIPLAAKS